jgi:hypothetical protein
VAAPAAVVAQREGQGFGQFVGGGGAAGRWFVYGCDTITQIKNAGAPVQRRDGSILYVTAAAPPVAAEAGYGRERV